MSIKRKTIFLDQGETLGGAERFLIDLFHAIDFPTWSVINPMILGAKSEAYQQAVPSRIPFVSYAYPSFGGNKFFAFIRLFFASFSFKKTLQKEFENVSDRQVFANTPRTMILAWFVKFFWRQSFRLIIMVHDFTIPSFVFRFIASQADTIIVNAVLTRQVVRNALPESEHEKIMIVENGIDFSALPTPVAQPNDTIKKIVLLGRIDPRKGQMFALESARIWQKHLLPVELIIIGSPIAGDINTQNYEIMLHKKAKEWHLENVSFVSEVKQPWGVFSEADLVLVLPTEPETFGRVVIEALAVNTPVVVFDEMGPREIVRNFSRFTQKDMSSFVCKKNVSALATTVENLVNNSKLCEVFWKQGRLFVQKYFDQNDTKKQFVNILLKK